MTTKRIVYRRSDGVVEIVNPTQRRMAQLMAGGETEDEAVAIIQANALSKMAERGFGPVGDVEVMEAANIPESQPGDRLFRNALEKPGLGPPIVNMPKARAIHAVRMARARADESARLGLAEAEARLQGNTTEADKAVADKVAVDGLDLATLATQIAAAANPVALQAVWSPLVPRPA